MSHALQTAAAIIGRVERVTALCREHVEIEFSAPRIPQSHPGQFVQLLCRGADDGETHAQFWTADGFPSLSDPDFIGRQAYLRRPFSIADRSDAPDGMTHLTVISRTVGAGTAWLEQLRPGDMLNFTGPLGRGFELPRVGRPLLLVGGGVGIPPLLYLARRLGELRHTDVTLICGATTRDLLSLHLLEEPAKNGTATHCARLPGGAGYSTLITSDDGSVGVHGLVTDGLRRHAELRALRGALVFACGPDGMLRALARLTRELGFECQLCVERSMGCGLGTCLSCIVRTADAGRPEGWRWSLACTDGPVFPRDALLDYASDLVTRP
jgi:dihydroorotate dehydrogenase electron transfer subunit